MDTNVIPYIIVSELISIWLVIRLWNENQYLAIKILSTCVVLIPFMGPIAYMFVKTSSIPPQDKNLQNTGSRGQYTHSLLSIKPIVKSVIKEKENELQNNDKGT